ncbi:hypothetical protein DFP98_12767 [Cohnella phaseoli]|uniref:Uncharacterized protein n=1 Tax=Cohnella phaseoli TaxID=456490 RepID=A0A3D9IMM0_9BACL|nr:hypothetical protein DFP98_12767 [Cohnella phaseoli]
MRTGSWNDHAIKRKIRLKCAKRPILKEIERIIGFKFEKS